MSGAWKALKGSRKVVDSTGALIAMVMPAESPEATAARAQLIAAAPELAHAHEGALALAMKLKAERDALQAQLDETERRRRLAGGVIEGLQVETGRLQAQLDEREADVHDRIRAGYDTTVADAWRKANAALQAQLDGARSSERRMERYAAGQYLDLLSNRHLLAWQQARGLEMAERYGHLDAQSGEIVELAMRHDVSPAEALVALSDGLTVHAERDAARAEVERLKRQLADEQDIAERCQAYCGECKGLCSPDDDAALSETGGER